MLDNMETSSSKAAGSKAVGSSEPGSGGSARGGSARGGGVRGVGAGGGSVRGGRARRQWLAVALASVVALLAALLALAGPTASPAMAQRMIATSIRQTDVITIHDFNELDGGQEIAVDTSRSVPNGVVFTYTLTGSQPACTTHNPDTAGTLTRTLAMGNDDSESYSYRVSTSNNVLVMRPGGPEGSQPPACVYTIDVPDVTHNGETYGCGVTSHRAYNAQLDADNSRINLYCEKLDAFEPVVTLDLPPEITVYRNVGGEVSVNNVGAELDVKFVRSGGPATRCSPTTTITYTVNSSGDTATQGTIMPGSNNRLVAQPIGVRGHCIYDVTFPDFDNAAAVHERRLFLTKHSSDDTEISGAAGANNAKATYESLAAATSRMDVEVKIINYNVPSATRPATLSDGSAIPTLDGTLIAPDGVTVSFELSTVPGNVRGPNWGLASSQSSEGMDYAHQYCTSVSATDLAFSGANDAEAVSSRFKQGGGTGSGALVRRQPGVAAYCEYDIIFPDIVQHGNNYYGLFSLPGLDGNTRLSHDTLVQEIVRPGAGVDLADVNEPQRTAFAYYEKVDVFTPNVTFHMPPVDIAGTTGLSLERATLDVTFTPTSSSNMACDTKTITYEINASGAPQAPSGAAGMLLDRPAGARTGNCVYDVTFAADSGGLLRKDNQSNDDNQVSAAAPAARVTYARTTTTFDATLAITNYNDTSGSDTLVRDSAKVLPNGVEFEVTIAKTASSPDGCTSLDMPVTLTMMSAVEERALEDGDALVLRPVDAMTDCEYNVTFPDSIDHTDGFTYARIPTEELRNASPALPTTVQPEKTTLTNGDTTARTALAFYEKVITFEPAVAFGLPPVDIEGTTGLSIENSELEVSFTRATGPDACSAAQAVTLTYTIDAAGAAATDGELDLLGQPVGIRQDCVYDVGFPTSDSANLLRQVADSATDDTSLSVSDAAAMATYERKTTVYPSADVSIFNFNKPEDRDAAETIAAVAARLVPDATTFTVPITPTSGSPANGCSDLADLELEVSGSVMFAAATALVLRPEGATADCEYDVGFPESIVHSNGNLYQRMSNAARGEQLTITSAQTSAFAYYEQALTFTPNVTFDLPSVMRPGDSSSSIANATIAVMFERSGGPTSGCSSKTITYTIDSAGVAQPPSDAAESLLVDVPVGLRGENCVYSVGFARSDSSGNLSKQTEADDDNEVSGADTAAKATYGRGVVGGTWMPTAAIMVPPIDGLTSGENLFAGVTFEIGIAPAMDADAACTVTPADPSPYTLSYTVQTDGMVTTDGTLPTLLDIPVGQTTRCEYTVTSTDMAASSAASSLSWTLALRAGSTDMVGAGTTAVTLNYDANDVTFVPQVNFVVPQYNADDDPATEEVDESASHAFAGAQFTVRFMRSSGPSSCPAESLTYTIDAASGSVTADDPSAYLVDYPAGETTRCAYAVTFPPNEDGGTELSRQAGATATASAAAQVLMAEYWAAESNFMPSVSGMVELVDENGDGTHDLSGGTLTVGYARAEDADSGCSASGSEVYVIGDDGALALAQPPAVDQAQSPAVLVDRPSGMNERCVYDVTYPAEATGAAVDAGDAAGPASAAGEGVPVAAGTLTQISAVVELVLNYATPLRPRVVPQPVPLMSANVGVERLPVQVTLVVPDGVFAAVDTFEVLVRVPGACGSDTFLFGGVPASAGVAYAAEASDTGQVVVLGEGAVSANRRAEYSLPPYVDGSAGREACAVRLSVLAVPQGCSVVGAAGVDEQDRPYIETVWAQGSVGFDLTASFDCPDLSVGDPTTEASVSLVQGWVTLTFNGPTGTTPREFAQLLDGAVSSMWVWNPISQSWRGWTQQHGVLGLPQLTRGETVMAYVPAETMVVYSPDDLLALPAPTGSLRLVPGYNLHTFNGDGPASLDVLLAEPWPVTVVFLWHSESQSWRYYLPEIGPIAGLGILWFDTIRPGDTVLMYSRAFSNVTYPWV